MLIRRATADDTDSCLKLLMCVREQDGYPLHATPDEARRFFPAGRGLGSWVAVEAGDVIGHVALRADAVDPTVIAAHRVLRLPADRIAIVSRLFTDPQQRRTGLGRLLLRHAADHATRIGMRAVLDVGQSLGAAVALYESEGWTRIGQRRVVVGQGREADLWVYASPTPAAAHSDE